MSSLEALPATVQQIGAGRTSSEDCICPKSSGGYRRGINPDCPWDGLHPETFRPLSMDCE